MIGRIISRPELGRATPYHPPHATAVAGLVNIKGGDNRFYNNIFVGPGGASAAPGKPAGKQPQRADGFGLAVYDACALPLQTGGNVYYRGARPYSKEEKPAVEAATDPQVRLEEERVHYQPAAPGAPFRSRVVEGGSVHLRLTLGQAVQNPGSRLVTTALLGRAAIPKLPYENPDGTPVTVGADYFGKKRDQRNPTPGPFEGPGTGELLLKVWGERGQP